MRKRTDLEIMEVLVASTGHLTPEEGAQFGTGNWADALKGDHLGSPIAWDYGWIFYVGGDWDPDAEQLGPGFTALVKLAREQGLEWIRFDEAGAKISGIPTYDW